MSWRAEEVVEKWRAFVRTDEAKVMPDPWQKLVDLIDEMLDEVIYG